MHLTNYCTKSFGLKKLQYYASAEDEAAPLDSGYKKGALLDG